MINQHKCITTSNGLDFILSNILKDDNKNHVWYTTTARAKLRMSKIFH